MDYLDFEIQVDSNGLDCIVAVLRSPAGEVWEAVLFPLDELELKIHLQALQIALLQSGGVSRSAPTAQQKTVQDFGQILFNFLFPSEVRSLYRTSLREAKIQGKGLRVKLNFLTADRASLPWEFLYDSAQGEYICLSANTSLIRYLNVGQPPSPLAVSPPLRILGMIASPKDLQELKVDVERQRLEEALQPLIAKGRVDLQWLGGQTWEDLQRALRGGPWHIFHFIGHGEFDARQDEGLIMLVAKDGKAEPLTATQLGRLLGKHDPLRLVVLNACEGATGSTLDIYSSTASILMRRGLPAVLAMQYKITDRAAIQFTTTFYESLADSLPIDAAVAEARVAISMGVNNSIEWGTPVLHMRAPDGAVFSVQTPPDTDITPKPRPAAFPPKLSPAQLVEFVDLSQDLTKKDDATKQRMPAQVRTPIPEKQPAPTPARSVEPIAFDWVTVPAGNLMGSDESKDAKAEDREMPQHTLNLPEYRIARVPVTVAQFRRFVEASGYRTTAERQGSAYGWTGATWEDVKGAYWAAPRGPASDVGQKAEHPVTCLSWEDAVAFCQWAEVRLPTEAQWEKAARGTDGRIFPWGNAEPDEKRCNFAMKVGDTTPVGSYPTGASPYGCLDMAGNVWEWTSSLYQGYPYDAGDGREDPAASGSRVLRGGSFVNNRLLVRCASRRSTTLAPGTSTSVFGWCPTAFTPTRSCSGLGPEFCAGYGLRSAEEGRCSRFLAEPLLALSYAAGREGPGE